MNITNLISISTMETVNNAHEAKGFYKLSWMQRIGFGSGDLAQNLIFQVTCMYLLFFYTDIYGLNEIDVSVMFLEDGMWHLLVVIYQYDGRDAEQVEQVNTDAKACHIGDEYKPSVAVRLVDKHRWSVFRHGGDGEQPHPRQGICRHRRRD